MEPIKLEQRIEVTKVGTRWRVCGYVGRRLIFFFAEAPTEELTFTARNEFTEADWGCVRAVNGRRYVIVGHGGKASVTPKQDGQKNEVQVTFQSVALSL